MDALFSPSEIADVINELPDLFFSQRDGRRHWRTGNAASNSLEDFLYLVSAAKLAGCQIPDADGSILLVERLIQTIATPCQAMT